uniref:Uncharacterized protein n=1 Tax=Dicentrarchus labrax TaxID=13489 RepID=A0A8C4DYG6_DICLA
LQTCITTHANSLHLVLLHSKLQSMGCKFCMFSLAVSIPDDQNQEISNILQQVFQSDPVEDVKEQLGRNEVYDGKRVVAARPLPLKKKKTDHAESRVADKLVDLFSRSNENDLLLFYVYASPCVDKCASDSHPKSILGRINQIQQWKNHAFVYSKIFESENTRRWVNTALQRLGTAVGLDNIFRCDRENGWMQCISCSSNNRNWSGFAFAFSKVADVSDASQQAESFKQLEISKLGLDNIFRCYNPGDSFQCTSCSSGGDVTPSCHPFWSVCVSFCAVCVSAFRSFPISAIPKLFMHKYSNK